MFNGGERMHGGERVIEPAFKKAKTDDQWRADPREAFLKISIVLTSQRQRWQVIRQRSSGIHVANNQVRPPADLQQCIRPTVGCDQRPRVSHRLKRRADFDRSRANKDNRTVLSQHGFMFGHDCKPAGFTRRVQARRL